MKSKTQILHRIREIEGEMSSLSISDSYVTPEDIRQSRDYWMNLGRLKALNWCLNKD